MSEYNAKNYTEQGGDVTHIGGKLIIEEGASVEGLASAEKIPVAANQAASTAEVVKGEEGARGLVDDFNDLLAKLKAAGIMKADEA